MHMVPDESDECGQSLELSVVTCNVPLSNTAPEVMERELVGGVELETTTGGGGKLVVVAVVPPPLKTGGRVGMVTGASKAGGLKSG